ncbi:uncharacterized protein LOC129216344 [Uloborus diversus]|uniref:uncharacterized protein LOC129216344 n=1 Tax=Uloborus diversus TaxID=327109 RepID=UPI00240912D3|nr:uncharacterized protein LOC129216344 [Uloborus diversus]
MFSGSKITDQSTPVKGFDCTQERGILEEPDLTLISTISSESYLQQKRHTDLDNLSNKENLELTLSVKNTPSICTDKTTTATSDSPFQTGCVDSPSMMSFMQHEISCLAQESAEEIKIKEKKKKTKVEYKKYQARTKRLWNNLEEVQKKHLQESKMQQLVMNRIKAKSLLKEEVENFLSTYKLLC